MPEKFASSPLIVNGVFPLSIIKLAILRTSECGDLSIFRAADHCRYDG